MKISEMIANINIIEIKGDIDMHVKGISYNSNLTKKGYVFVAIEGLKLDGHQYISDAVAKGAKVIIVSKDIENVENVTIIKVADTRLVLSSLSSFFYGKPSKEIELIGITGTNGKTTTSHLLKSILSTFSNSIGVIGTLGVDIKTKSMPTNLTTPESLELHKIFRSMVDEKVVTCILEVSSHSIKLKRINDCDFNIGIFTNLTHEHLDFHKTIEDYYDVKKQLFFMTNRFNIINTDDSFGNRLANDVSSIGIPLLTYGIETKAEITAEQIISTYKGSQFTLSTPKGKIGIKINFPGKYNVYNSMAAAACGYAMGIDLEKIKKGLEASKDIPGRFEAIPGYRDRTVIIDYAHTPDGLKNLLETVHEFSKGRIILVFGCVGERDRSKRSIMGKIAAQYCNLCILTTDNCRSENPEKIIEDIKEGFSIDTPYIQILDRAEANQYAILSSKKNDTILITGKGHEHQQIIGDQVLYFNEKDIIRSSLNELSQKLQTNVNIKQ